MTEGVHSTGRGGAGNIGKEAEPTHYADGSIVHEGVYGESHRPQYSAGRGGVANMGKSPKLTPADAEKGKGKAAAGAGEKSPLAAGATAGPAKKTQSADVIPETAMRAQLEGGYHTGRGGVGNARPGVFRSESGSKNAVQKVEGKVKQLFGMDKEKEKERE